MSDKRFTPSPYHLMSAAEKRAASSLSVREAAVSCPSCGTQVMPVDLIPHVEQRCVGPRMPGPGSKWVKAPEVYTHDVPDSTLSDWVKTGKVTRRGSRGDYEYLWRDLAPLIALRVISRRRNSGGPESSLDTKPPH